MAKCAAIVTRDWQEEPCDKRAVGFLIDPDEGNPFPACAWHLNRWHWQAVRVTAAVEALVMAEWRTSRTVAAVEQENKGDASW